MYSVIYYYYFQHFSVQCILAASGNVSFAIFLYDAPDKLNETVQFQVGFDSGDGQRYHMILQDVRTDLEPLQAKYIFRIDGKLP